MQTRSRKLRAFYLKNFIFGVEDSLVSTVGLLSGVAAAELSRSAIILAGLVLIFVEAFSMGVGSFLSEDVAEDYKRQADSPDKQQARGGLVMFGSYFLSGFIPLFPYLFMPVRSAFWVSIALALLTLFLLGFYGGQLAHSGSLRHGLKMLAIGGTAIILGVLVGTLVQQYS